MQKLVRNTASTYRQLNEIYSNKDASVTSINSSGHSYCRTAKLTLVFVKIFIQIGFVYHKNATEMRDVRPTVRNSEGSHWQVCALGGNSKPENVF